MLGLYRIRPSVEIFILTPGGQATFLHESHVIEGGNLNLFSLVLSYDRVHVMGNQGLYPVILKKAPGLNLEKSST